MILKNLKDNSPIASLFTWIFFRAVVEQLARFQQTRHGSASRGPFAIRLSFLGLVLLLLLTAPSCSESLSPMRWRRLRLLDTVVASCDG